MSDYPSGLKWAICEENSPYKEQKEVSKRISPSTSPFLKTGCVTPTALTSSSQCTYKTRMYKDPTRVHTIQKCTYSPPAGARHHNQTRSQTLLLLLLLSLAFGWMACERVAFEVTHCNRAQLQGVSLLQIRDSCALLLFWVSSLLCPLTTNKGKKLRCTFSTVPTKGTRSHGCLFCAASLFL